MLKPGGQALSLDFNRPANALVRSAYLLYLTIVGGVLGWLLHRDPGHLPVHSRRRSGSIRAPRPSAG